MATATLSLDQFVDLVRKSGVADATRLETVLAAQPTSHGKPEEARELADRLVQAGALTEFQAHNLLAGRYKGLVVGKYKLLKLLGRGGMGRVFLGEHLAMRSRAALKILPAMKGGGNVERFLREARAAAAVNHPNIVRAFDLDNADGMHFLVMEYVPGATLQSVIASHGPAHPDQAAHWVAQAAQGLQHIGELGLVHRDIKPSNLMLDRDGTVKVMDLGLALFREDTADDLTARGEGEGVLGTTDYLAPEQAVEFHAVDVRGDLYSLGATFYFLLTGRPPFEGTTAQKLLHHQMRDPKPVTTVRQDVPPAMLAVLAKMMAKSPADRYQQPFEVTEALLPFAERGASLPVKLPADVDLGPVTAGSRTTLTKAKIPITARQPAVIKPPPKRAVWPWAVAAAVVVVGGGVAAALALRSRPDDSPGATIPDRPVVVQPPVSPPPPATAPTLRPVQTVAVFAGKGVDSVAFTADGTRLLAAGNDPVVVEWDIAAGGIAQRFAGHTKPVRAAAYSPDESQVVSAGADGTIRVWDRKSGQQVRQVADAGKPVRWLHVTAGLKPRLFACGADGKVTAYDWATGEPGAVLTSHPGTVECVRVAPDGKTAVSCGSDKTVRFWNLAERRETDRATLDAIPNRCSVSPDGRWVAVGVGVEARLVSVTDPAEQVVLGTHATPVTAVQVLGDGRHAVSGSHDGVLKVWDVAARALVAEVAAHGNRVWSLALSPGGKRLASGSLDGTAKLWDVPAAWHGGLERTLPAYEKEAGTAAVLPSGLLVTAAEAKGGAPLKVWDVRTGVVVRELPGHTAGVRSLAVHPHDGTLLSVGGDRFAQVWDPDRPTPLKRFDLATGGLSCAWLPDGTRFLIGGPSGRLQLRDARTGKLEREYPGHTGNVSAVLPVAAGRQFVSAGNDRTVRLWDTDTGEELRSETQLSPVWRLDLSPDGRRVAFGCGATVRVVDAATLKGRTIAVAGTTAVPHARFLPDGRHLLAVGHDGAVRLLDIDGEREVARLMGHAEAALFAVLLDGGTRAATACRDGTVGLWTLPVP